MHQDSYAGSCNPSRRAKQLRIDTAPAKKPIAPPSNPPRNILPLPTQHTDILPDDDAADAPSQSGPAKRGRKPGPLSRSARETQRKLNHSIIEKARRTKINDALATLRQLVPADYGYPKTKPEQDDEASDDEDDGQKREKPKKPSKREEKEKEFKLEILVRTVSFMQDLLARVKVLEEGGSGECSECAQKASSKRSYDQIDPEIDQSHEGSGKRSRKENTSSDIEPIKEASHLQQQAFPDFLQRPYLGSRLPPISSWLPNSQIDPLLLSPAQRRAPEGITQLPSPPSSTHFDPIQTSQVPPVLNLGPVATSSLLSPRRTPEDESAASLLLQISANSPQLLPVASSAPGTSFDMSKMRTSCVTPVDHTTAPLAAQAQTPGSMLGLMRRG